MKVEKESINKMKELIMSNVSTELLSHNTIWRRCDSPQGAESALFDTVILELEDQRRLMSGRIQGTQSTKGYRKP